MQKKSVVRAAHFAMSASGGKGGGAGASGGAGGGVAGGSAAVNAYVDDAQLAWKDLWSKYASEDPKVKLVDVFLLGCVAVAGFLMLYVFLVGSYPFNAFLSALFAAVGLATLFGACTAMGSAGGRGREGPLREERGARRAHCLDPDSLPAPRAASLRMQMKDVESYPTASEYQALAEFLVSAIVLLFAAINFVG